MKFRMPVLAFLAAATLSACGGDSAPSKFTLAVIGDTPYGASPTDTAELDTLPAFISAINADTDVSMVVHTGDIHSGKQYCTDTFNQAVAQAWTAFKTPLIYTPGDNEWMDCHKKKEGGGLYNAATNAIDYVMNGTAFASYAKGDPLANLDLVRSIFFKSPGKTLGKSMDVHSQASDYNKSYPNDSKYVENTWFEKTGVMFATANVPGGSNNGTDPWYSVPAMTAAQTQEVSDRTGATLRWLDLVFSTAKSNGDIAIVLTIQADLWDLDGKNMSDMHLTEHKQYIDKLASLTAGFGKPVLLINGDSHLYRSDNPLVRNDSCKIEVPSLSTASKSVNTTTCANSVANGALKDIVLAGNPTDPYLTVQDKTNSAYVPSYSVPNFHRIAVHGNATPSGTYKEYIKLTVDPAANNATSENAFGPFSWVRVQP